MIGVALILALGAYFVLVLVCAKRDQGVVVRELTPQERLRRAILDLWQQVGVALLPVAEKIADALVEVADAFTSAADPIAAFGQSMCDTMQRVAVELEHEIVLSDDWHLAWDDRPLL